MDTKKKELRKLYKQSDLQKANDSKFLKDFKIERELKQTEKEKLFGQKRGHLVIQHNVQVPDGTEHAKYYLAKDGYILIKGEPYELDQKRIENFITFCKKHKWTFSIHQGYESHYPGRTIAVVLKTGKRLIDFKK